MRDWVITQVTFGVGGIAKEDTRERSLGEFVEGSGSSVGIAEAPEDAKIVIGWGRPEQKMMRCIAPSRFAWPDIEKESGGGKSIGPKPGGHVCMEKQRTNTLIEGAKNTFGTTVLLRCIWTCEMKNGAMSG